MRNRTSIDRMNSVGNSCCVRLACALVVLVAAITGCSSEDPRFQSMRDQYILASEPDSPSTIEDATLAVGEGSQVEIVGRIMSKEKSKLAPGKAIFMVSEILPNEHGHDDPDHADDCPFCKRRQENAPKAAIQLVDSSGETLTVDPLEALGIEAGDSVVVRGTGKMMADIDMLLVTADGIHVRQATKDR